MEDAKNDRAVEKRMKDALRFDRARVQMGKISSFGLMELSRQRRRMSILEGSSHVCEHCGGAGHVRSIESSALHLLRALDDHAAKHRAQIIEARAPAEVALYVLNEKRETLSRLEEGRGVQIRVVAVETLLPPDFELTTTGEHHPAEPAPVEARARVDDDEAAEPEIEAEEDEEEQEAQALAETGDGGERRRRRRRGRRGGRRQREGGEAGAETHAASIEADDESEAGEEAESESEAAAEAPAGERNGRRRRRRRGRGGRRPEGGAPALADAPQPYESDDAPERAALTESEAPAAPHAPEPEPEPEPVAAPAYEAPAPVMPEPVYAHAPEPAPEREALPATLSEAGAALMDEEAPQPPPQTDIDYAPDQERREKFFARLSRWGRKEQD
jgi:ribonuclease E